LRSQIPTRGDLCNRGMQAAACKGKRGGGVKERKRENQKLGGFSAGGGSKEMTLVQLIWVPQKNSVVGMQKGLGKNGTGVRAITILTGGVLARKVKKIGDCPKMGTHKPADPPTDAPRINVMQKGGPCKKKKRGGKIRSDAKNYGVKEKAKRPRSAARGGGVRKQNMEDLFRRQKN